MSDMDEDEGQSTYSLASSFVVDESSSDETTSEEEESIDYSAMTTTELKALCKEKGLTGYSSMTKAELIELLNSQEG